MASVLIAYSDIHHIYHPKDWQIEMPSLAAFYIEVTVTVCMYHLSDVLLSDLYEDDKIVQMNINDQLVTSL